MVSAKPLPHLLSAEDRARMEGLESEVVEDAPAPGSNGHVASSGADLRTSEAIRYRQAPIVGLSKIVRFRSLTTDQFIAVSEEQDQNLLLYSVCDANGHLYLTDADIEWLKGKESDARTYMHLISVANDHCLAGATLEGLTEAAAKNSRKQDSTSTD